MLRDIGHRVAEASGGAQALGMLRAGLDVDVVVTDFKMPRMDGAQLARRLHGMVPDLPILLITGYTGTTEDISDLPRLSKPFRQADLAAALAGLVDPDGKVVRMPLKNVRPGD
jgi:CheY-like chemotaxis protein